MSLLLPIAGTVALSLARETIGAIGSGLSFATELLRHDRDPAGATPPEPIAIAPSAAKEHFASALEAFVGRLRQRLATVGIDLHEPLELADDGLGGIQVQSDRADRTAIEQLLAGDEQLVSEFQRLGVQHQELTASDERPGNFALRVTNGDAEVIAG